MSLKWDDIKKLSQKKYRQEHQHFLIEGEHLVLELEKATALHPELHNAELLVTEAQQNFVSRLPKRVISDKHMAQISDTETPPGIMAIVPFFSAQNDFSQRRCVYLHEVQDPGNLGSILRSLAWFGHFYCCLSPGCVDPYNSKVLRASMGAIFHVPLLTDVRLESIAQRYKKLAVLDMNGLPLSDKSITEQHCFVFGNEARGVPHEALSAFDVTRYTIPGSGTVESLNLAAAVAMCAYEINRCTPP